MKKIDFHVDEIDYHKWSNRLHVQFLNVTACNGLPKRSNLIPPDKIQFFIEPHWRIIKMLFEG
jgi:hypothetical protein